MKFIVLIRACGAIEPCLFVASFLTMFHTVVSYFKPTKEMQTFIYTMESVRLIRRKDIRIIRRGVQITKRITIGNRDGIWEQI